MKRGENDHTTPLSERAIRILRSIHDDLEARGCFDPEGYVFPGTKPGKGMSNVTMESLLRRMFERGLLPIDKNATCR